MSYSKDTLCWRCKGNSGPSRAFAFWNIQQNERPHRENGRNGETDETNGEGKNQDVVEKCECASLEEEVQNESVAEVVLGIPNECTIDNSTGKGMRNWSTRQVRLFESNAVSSVQLRSD